MEGRARRRGTGASTSPGRNKVWVEPPGKSHHRHPPRRSPPPPPPAAGKRVAVVYYLCRSRHLEHPHFIEVPLANPEAGLYLRGQSPPRPIVFPSNCGSRPLPE
jgi:hypothetical protein